MPLRGGRRLMAKTILNFHFDYLTPSLIRRMSSALWEACTQSLFAEEVQGWNCTTFDHSFHGSMTERQLEVPWYWIQWHNHTTSSASTSGVGRGWSLLLDRPWAGSVLSYFAGFYGVSHSLDMHLVFCQFFFSIFKFICLQWKWGWMWSPSWARAPSTDISPLPSAPANFFASSGKNKLQGAFFNCSSQFSVPKWKTMSSQSEILFHEILNVQKILVGWTMFFF